MDDLELQLEQASRSRKLADILRKKAIESQFQENPGRMVSGHYVAPSWAQGLNQVVSPIMDRQVADQAESSAYQQEAGSNALRQTALKNWQASMPQDVPGTPEQAGPVDPGNPTELNAVAPRPVTTGQILKHTLAGGMIPGNEKMSALYNTSAMANLNREDTQQFRREESSTARAAALQRQIDDRASKSEELRTKLEDKNLDRAQKEVLASRHDDLMRQLAADSNELKRMAIEAKRNATTKAANDKPVPSPIMKVMSGLEQQAEGLSNVAQSYKPAYAGGWGAFNRLSGTWNPFSDKESEEAANWWKNYENQAALVERHEKFGTALSSGEQAAWRNATIYPGMKDSVISANLKMRADVAEKLFERSRGEFIRGGYDKVGEAFPSRSTKSAPTQAEVDKMPRGTKFTGPDGKEYVKD